MTPTPLIIALIAIAILWLAPQLGLPYDVPSMVIGAVIGAGLMAVLNRGTATGARRR